VPVTAVLGYVRVSTSILCGVAGDDVRDYMNETTSQVDQGFTQISSIRGAIDDAGAVVAGQQRIIDLLPSLIDRLAHYSNGSAPLITRICSTRCVLRQRNA
jgi:hypothetical protein